jgi:hypothetical protein
LIPSVISPRQPYKRERLSLGYQPDFDHDAGNESCHHEDRNYS